MYENSLWESTSKANINKAEGKMDIKLRLTRWWDARSFEIQSRVYLQYEQRAKNMMIFKLLCFHYETVERHSMPQWCGDIVKLSICTIIVQQTKT